MIAKNNLESSWRKRLEAFRAFTVGHYRLLQVTDDIKRTMIYRGHKGFIYLVGPTHTGKTTALTELRNSILRDSIDEMIKDPGFLPIAGMEAPCREPYDWRDHWFGCLEALNEPAIKHKSERAGSGIDQAKFERHYNSSSKGESLLCRSFVNAARQRKLQAFLLDEAQHLTFVRGGKRLRPQLEKIKSVANRSGAMHVLCGTYDLLKLRNASGQLGSRGVTIHFSRYRPDSDEDLKSFADTVLSLVGRMGFPEPPDLTEDLDYCFDMSLGCIGLLKVWFTVALGSALENGRKTLTRRDLEKHRPSANVLDRISQEIVDGEALLEEDQNLLPLIRLRLMQKTETMPQKPNSEYLDELPEEKPVEVPAETFGKTETKKSGARKSRIERKPRRDKVNEGRKKRAA